MMTHSWLRWVWIVPVGVGVGGAAVWAVEMAIPDVWAPAAAEVLPAAPRNEVAAPVSERILVRYKPGVSRTVKEETFRAAKVRRIRKEYRTVPDLQLLEVEPGAAADAIRVFKRDSRVLYAEPDVEIELLEVPNDKLLGPLWGLRNTGQPGSGAFCFPTGQPGADIDATRAWDFWTGDSDFRIAIIDTGIDYRHPDLAANVWTNPAESPGDANGDGCPGACGVDDDNDGWVDEDSGNRVPADPAYADDLDDDDDENGWADDIHGFDPFNGDGDPLDDHSHGTHVAGTIGAVGNNGIGVAGINWRCKLVALKVFGASGSAGSLSYALEAVEYVTVNRIRLSNNSWGFNAVSQAMYDAIAASRDVGHVFVAAAGNEGSRNNDALPQFPASYDLANVLSVAAVNNRYVRAPFTSLGRTTVDLAAPGACVYSTVLNGLYDYKDGTSMATPHVTGVLGLILSRSPDLNFRLARERVLYTVRPVGEFADTTLFGGALDAAAAVGDCNRNGRLDEIDISLGVSRDCSGNGVPDECEPDCDANGIADSCDLLSGAGRDCNDNAQLDQCEPDCNGNGQGDSCDVAQGVGPNCNRNFIPDVCEIAAGSPAPGGPYFCVSRCERDCNLNGVIDRCELAAGATEDCTFNGVPDECEPDCNANGAADSCDIADEISLDCSFNRVPDECEPDCNTNGAADSCDIRAQISRDCNENLVPDECEPTLPDCDANGIPDTCDLNARRAHDCNGNNVLDVCDLRDETSLDVDATGIPDECDGRGFFVVPIGADSSHEIVGNRITLLGGGHRLEFEVQLYGWDLNGDGAPLLRAYEFRIDPVRLQQGDYGKLELARLPCGSNVDCFGRGACLGSGFCHPHASAFIDRNRPNYVFFDQLAVQAVNPMLTAREFVFASALWRQTDALPDDGLVKYAGTIMLDVSPLAAGTFTVGFADRLAAQLLQAAGVSIPVPTLNEAEVVILPDCNQNEIPDDLDIAIQTSADCNENLIPDECLTLEADCNGNTLPDACDIQAGHSVDCNRNGVPDECLSLEQDCNENALPDACDIESGSSEDCNANVVPDECLDLEGDCNENLTPDSCDIAVGWSVDCNRNGVPDECLRVEGDCNGNFIPDSCDLASGLDADCNQNGLPDRCDLDADTSDDCDGDEVPDECISPKFDCNGNDIPDSCDIADGQSDDCNKNAVPDECDIEKGVSADGNGDGVPDECRSVYRVPRHSRTLQGAIRMARSGDLILVADGVYRGEGNTSVTFEGKALTLRSENGPAACIIDAVKNERAFVFAQGETANSRLEGFTITGGYATSGGGIRCLRSSPTIHGCFLVGNSAANHGGALHCDQMSNPTISHCVFAQNSANVDGGAIYCQNQSSPLIRNCLFVRNRAVGGGAGVYCDTLSEPTISFCTFTANVAQLGGAIHVARRVEIATPIPGGPRILNSILWADNGLGAGDEIYLARGARLIVEYSNVLGGSESAAVNPTAQLIWEQGNLNMNPVFLAAGGADGDPDSWEDNNYRLSRLSPCVNAASSAPLEETSMTDLDGHARVLCGQADMGAYESGIGNFDCENGVNLLDFQRWIDCRTGPEHDRATPLADGCEAFDFNYDHAVDLADFARWQVRFRP